MRSSILPAGVVLFLLSCLAGCGGGDSTEVATAEGGGGEGSTAPAAPDGGSDPAQMHGGGETQGEGSAGGSGSRSDGGSDPAQMHGSEETQGEGSAGGSGSRGDGDSDPAGMYGGGEEMGEYDEEDSANADPAEMYGGGEDSGEHDEEDSANADPAEMYAGGEDSGEHDEEDSANADPAEMYAGGEDSGEHDEEDSANADPAEMYGSGEDRGDGGEYGPMRGAEGGRPNQAAKPKTFADMAAQAFGQGRDTDAFQFLFAHVVTADDQSARELLSKVGWIGPQKRPGLAVRWGLGIEFNSKGYNGDKLYPIGTTQKVQDRNPRGFGQRRDDDGGGFGGQDMGAGQSGFGGDMQSGRGGSNAQLERLTGEVGQKVIDGLKERIERGDFGLVLKDAGSAGTTNQGRGPGGYGQYDSGAEMGNEENFGDDNTGAPGDMRGAGGNRGADGPVQLAAGVTLVGLAPAKDLVKTAKEAGVDVLCVFNVAVTQIRRTGQISNNVEIQLYNVADGKKTYEGDRLNNLAVQKEREQENARGGDSVDKELEKLFKEIDTNWRLAAFPTGLQPEHVLGRIKDLLQETHQNPLPVLAEIRGYHTRGLLQDNHLLLAYQRKTNDQSGTVLATGTEEERKQVIEPWLPARGRPGRG